MASGEGGGGEVSPERVRRPSHQSVVVRGGGGGEGEGEATLCLMSPDRRKRQTLSMSGSAYSVESGGLWSLSLSLLPLLSLQNFPCVMYNKICSLEK